MATAQLEQLPSFFTLESATLSTMSQSFNFDDKAFEDIFSDPSLFNSFAPTSFAPAVGLEVAPLPSYVPSAISSGSSPQEAGYVSSGSDDNARLKASSSTLLAISEEEREMLEEDGVFIPTDALTLTKAEERALKLVRRKLKNKLSAQDSRRKKKEYLEGLEKRVESCTAVNIDMQHKVATLATENRTLRQQLVQLQQLVTKLTGGAPTVATTGTVLMVLALSFSMFVNPSATSVVGANSSTPAARTLKSLSPAFSHAAAPPSALRSLLSAWLGLTPPDLTPTDDDDLPAATLGRGPLHAQPGMVTVGGPGSDSES